MPLASSGQISLNDLHVEAGGTTGTQASMNDADIRGLLGADANSQMTFSGFYGASAAIGQIASGNSTYIAAGEYNAAQWYVRSTADKQVLNDNGHVTNRPTFTLNNIDAQFKAVSAISSTITLHLYDFSSSASALYTANTSSLPANSGWTRMKLKNASGTVIRNLTRSSASYTAQASQNYDNSTTVFRYYTQWHWTGQTSNPFPNSNNTTLFTVELE
jgi:hypothetical protein